MASSGDHDMCKFVLNSIAIINEEDIVHEKLGFSVTPSQILAKRNFTGILKIAFDSKNKWTTLAVIGVCWLGYATA